MGFLMYLKIIKNKDFYTKGEARFSFAKDRNYLTNAVNSFETPKKK